MKAILFIILLSPSLLRADLPKELLGQWEAQGWHTLKKGPYSHNEGNTDITFTGKKTGESIQLLASAFTSFDYFTRETKQVWTFENDGTAQLQKGRFKAFSGTWRREGTTILAKVANPQNPKEKVSIKVKMTEPTNFLFQEMETAPEENTQETFQGAANIQE